MKINTLLLFCIFIADYVFAMNFEIGDTLILIDRKVIYKNPDIRPENEIKWLEENTKLVVVNDSIVPDQSNDENYHYVKVKTHKNEIGYVLANFLVSKKLFNAHADSIAFFKLIKQPPLDSMIGKPCLDANHVNNEVELIFPWNYLDDKRKYATISAANRYNSHFWYLLLVSSPDSACIIMDITPVNLAQFPKGSEIDFGNCSKGNESFDTSEIISLLHVDPEKYKSGQLIKPFKSWKADLKTNKINVIPVQDINCRQQNPEEMFNGP